MGDQVRADASRAALRGTGQEPLMTLGDLQAARDRNFDVKELARKHLLEAFGTIRDKI